MTGRRDWQWLTSLRLLQGGTWRAPRTWLLTGLTLLGACTIALATLWATGQLSAATAATAAAPTSPPAQPTPSPTAATAPHYVFPVDGKVSYARAHHDYPASDVIATCGAPVRAVTDGVILELSRTDRYDPRTDDGATRGGLFVSLLGDDGVRYYGSHLSAVAIAVGQRVRAGQVVGAVGRTGDAGVCHLHFGISPPCARNGDWWIRRGVIWPWSYLDSWRSGGSRSPAGAVTSWYEAHGCPPAPA